MVKAARMDKAADAFRTISEVAEDLDLPQHVLRFWETRFAQIKPLKRSGGRRYYRPDDVELLRAIQHLLYGEGYTIKGVQRILKEQGVKAIVALHRQGGTGPVFTAGAVPPQAHGSVQGLEEESPEGEASQRPMAPPPLIASGLGGVDAGEDAAAQQGLAMGDTQDFLEALLQDLEECRRILDGARA